MVAKLNTRFTAVKVLSLTALVFALSGRRSIRGLQVSLTRHKSPCSCTLACRGALTHC